jgi:hypothetical protein
VCALAACAAGSSCSQTVQWTSTRAPDFTASGRTVSVFGVYKDGQMSSEAWTALRGRVEPQLGGGQCAIAHGDGLAEDPLFAAVDDYTRKNGPTEDLLTQIAPAAQGDLILVLVQAGRLPDPEAPPSVVNSKGPAGPGPSATSGKAGLNTYAPDKRSDAGSGEVLQLSASLYSVARRTSVALIDLRYSGDSVDEAEREFAAGVGRLLPGVTCKGWDWSAKVDLEQVRKLAEE